MLPRWNASAKGKAHKRYEFGCKTSVATTSKSNWIVGTQALHGNPYDGHTLGGAIQQVERLTGRTPEDVMVDQGYRGHGYGGAAIVHVIRTIPKRATRAMRRMLKRRAAIEPTIGHLKSDNRMNRNYLTGREGDKINAAAGRRRLQLPQAAAVACFCADFLALVPARGQVGHPTRSPPRAEPLVALAGFAPARNLKITPTHAARPFISDDYIAETLNLDYPIRQR